MKITPEISAIKNAYMKAESANDSQEMNRLKAKAMELVNQQKASGDVKIGSKEKDTDAVLTNEDGDALQLSTSEESKPISAAGKSVEIDSRGESGVTNEHGDRLEIGSGRTTESS